MAKNKDCSVASSLDEKTISQISPIDETLDMQHKEKDIISKLPDCLLVDILSRLPLTKDAIATSTLSKRWRYLWTSVSSLIFRQLDEQPTSHFVSSVNKILIQRRPCKLRKFELSMEYDVGFESLVNFWIIFAKYFLVEELNISMLDWNFTDAQLLLDENIFFNPCFTDVELYGCKFDPSGIISCRMLRRLCLSDMFLDEDMIENVLVGSPVLETLVLQSCYGYSRLNITSKSVKNLVISGYNDPFDDLDLGNVIEINAPYLLTMKILSDLLLWKIILLDVSTLVDAEFNYAKLGKNETTSKETREEMLKGLIQSVGHVKELRIGSYCSEALYRLEAKGFLTPSNVKVVDGPSYNYYSD